MKNIDFDKIINSVINKKSNKKSIITENNMNNQEKK